MSAPNSGSLIPSMPVELLIDGDPVYPMRPQSAAPPGRVAGRPQRRDDGRYRVTMKDGRQFIYPAGTSLLGAQIALRSEDATG